MGILFGIKMLVLGVAVVKFASVNRRTEFLSFQVTKIHQIRTKDPISLFCKLFLCVITFTFSFTTTTILLVLLLPWAMLND